MNQPLHLGWSLYQPQPHRSLGGPNLGESRRSRIVISSSEVFTTAEITTVVRRSNRKTQRMTLKLGKDCYPMKAMAVGFTFLFDVFLGVRVGGLKLKDIFCGGFVWMLFSVWWRNKKDVLVVGGERVLLASPKFCWYDTVFLRGNKSIFKSSSCLCIWPRLVKLEYKRFWKKWKNNRCQLPFSTLPNLKRVCLVKDWSSGTSTIIILDVYMDGVWSHCYKDRRQR